MRFENDLKSDPVMTNILSNLYRYQLNIFRVFSDIASQNSKHFPKNLKNFMSF